MTTEALTKLLKENPALYKALMAQVGCEKSLYRFTEAMWEFVEPANPFVPGWHMEVICDHLEAVFRGDITRLLINVPPGMAKSILLSVFFPAWCWIHRPSHRFLCTSYSAGLTERDNIRFRQVITSDLYRAMWGDRFGFSRDSFNITKMGNDKTGWKIATSTEGLGTGERADVVICIFGGQNVLTECGNFPIEKIVNDKIRVRVMSMDIKTGFFSWKRIIEWKKNPGAEIIEISFSNGESVKCTPDHRIWTSNRGWARADSLLSSDVLPCAPALDLVNSIFVNPKYPSKINLPLGGIKNITHLIFVKVVIGSHFAISALSVLLCFVAPCSSGANRINKRYGNPIAFGNISGTSALPCDGDSYFASNFFVNFSISRNMGSVPFGIGDILLPCSVINILNAIIDRVSILMANIVVQWSRADEGKRHHLMNPEHFGFSILSCVESVISSISFTWRGFKDFLRNRKIPGSTYRYAGMSFDSPHVADAIKPLQPRYCSPLFIRKIGHVSSTYCLTVEDNHTFCVGDSQHIVVSNCDDLHNVRDGESQAVRKSTLQYFTEVLPTRLTNPISSAIVVIMQRVAEDDVAGHIIANNLGYDHVLLPMEFESGYPLIPTSLGFTDPRTEEGELLFPARFPRDVVERDKKVMGPYAVSSQFQQRPVPRGGGIIKSDYWKLWPEAGEDFDAAGLPAKKMEYPVMDYVLASVDTAYTSKTSSDFNACAILGLWRKTGIPKIMLMQAWQKRLDFRGEQLPRLPDEPEEVYRVRRKKAWGMLEWTAFECKRFDVDKLLIEGKATGITLAQEIRKVYNNEGWSTQVINPRGDKEARAYSVQHIWAEGMVYAPERDWATEAIDECAKFPKGAHDDIVDAIVQGVRWLRDSGWALRRDEVRAEDKERNKYISGKREPLYPA